VFNIPATQTQKNIFNLLATEGLNFEREIKRVKAQNALYEAMGQKQQSQIQAGGVYRSKRKQKDSEPKKSNKGSMLSEEAS
jgi:hypothetical protein